MGHDRSILIKGVINGGFRPDSTQIFDLQTHFRTKIPDVVTLPQYFKQQGYHTEWWGKIFHAALLDPVSLGEYGDWAKHTNFEIDARVPLIVRIPDMLGKGEKTDALVELVDLYPSLCELAGLPLPGHLQGSSFVPLLKDPTIPWKKAAFSQYPRGKLMGYSMRTERYRFTRWQKAGKFEEVEALELYDLHEDPHALLNLADKPENSGLIITLTSMMREENMGTS